jgi:hypothetical protein
MQRPADSDAEFADFKTLFHCVDCCLCDLVVLHRGAAAYANRANNLPSCDNRYAASRRHDPPQR